MPIPLIVLVVVVIVVAVVLVVIGLRSPQGSDPLQDRLAEFAAKGEPVNLEQIELSQSFMDRVLFPLARRLGEITLRFTPQNAILAVTKKLDMAGNPGGIDPTLFFAFRFLGIPLGGVVLLFGKILPRGNLFQTKGLLIAIPASILGFYLPDLLIKTRIDRRQKEIRKSMPDALDLLTICVEAGLGFGAAMAKVHEKWDNEIGRAFGRVNREVQLGKLQREALKDMADRLGVPEMTSFVAAVLQSEALGVSMAHILRIQSDQMRIKRRQYAEELAHQAPIKMLIPMAIFIFPSICIVMMTPAVLILMNSGAGAAFGGG